MKSMKMKNLLILVVILLLSILSSCGKKKHKKNRENIKDSISKKSDDSPGNADSLMLRNCDTSLWKFVYNPERLNIILNCKTVTGVIEESNADEDGDQHMLLRLDSAYTNMLTKKNYTKKQGNLVIEAVCVNRVMVKKVGQTCNGYINNILLPKIGDHVQVTGSYVIDTHNDWAEIHPIMNLQIISSH